MNRIIFSILNRLYCSIVGRKILFLSKIFFFLIRHMYKKKIMIKINMFKGFIQEKIDWKKKIKYTKFKKINRFLVARFIRFNFMLFTFFFFCVFSWTRRILEIPNFYRQRNNWIFENRYQFLPHITFFFWYELQ